MQSFQSNLTEKEAVKKYERMKKVGATPHIVYRVVTHDGFRGINSMRMLRMVFPVLGIADAKAVMIEVDTGMSADEYYKQLLPGIEAALDEIDKEHD